MTAPNIQVTIEPSDGEAVVYEPAAARSQSDSAPGLVCLLITIKNNETTPIHLDAVAVSFNGLAFPPLQVLPVPENWVPPNGHGITIAPGASGTWNFLRETFENDTIFLSSQVPPVPTTITVGLQFTGFSTEWRVTKPLAAHQNPVSGGAYLYPGQIDDLRPMEFWQGASNVHLSGAAGSQLFGYDMVVTGFDPSNPARLSELLPGTDGSKNEHYRVWGKRVHALADGTVLNALSTIGTNPNPLSADGPWQQSTAPFAPAGNHFYIQHGAEIVLYAHMQQGSLNADFLKPGTPVKAGDFLGLAGHSGSASPPHLHIHAIKGSAPEQGPLRPLLFRSMSAVDAALVQPPALGPWVSVERQGLPVTPRSTAVIWPSPTLPV